jgi:hypothetical protein
MATKQQQKNSKKTSKKRIRILTKIMAILGKLLLCFFGFSLLLICSSTHVPLMAFRAIENKLQVRMLLVKIGNH